MDQNSEKKDGAFQSSASRDQVIGRALAGRIPTGEGSCPTSEQIATLVDGLLTGAERDRLLGHLASCRSCRESFLVASELAGGEGAVGSPRRWLVLPFLAAAMLAFLALRLAPELLHPTHTELASQPRAPLRVAELPAQAPRVAIQAAPKAPRQSRTGTAVAGKKAEPLNLLSAKEAAQPAGKTYGFGARERSDGPSIVVESPAQDGKESQIAGLRIKFAPESGNGVDLSTLKVECLKDKPIDLTLRLKPYVTRQGIHLEKFKAPAGSYRFRVSVADYMGRFSEKEFTVNVSGNF
jgi:hypothetical protein